jgi:hypothetical protein
VRGRRGLVEVCILGAPPRLPFGPSPLSLLKTTPLLRAVLPCTFHGLLVPWPLPLRRA